ncbi:hypothetical protein FB451DRAFT_1170274 [Mycena latifolia]|nr:hypothetical protein FB451DRAFT_1170274 [Mycena latifolia]
MKSDAIASLAVMCFATVVSAAPAPGQLTVDISFPAIQSPLQQPFSRFNRSFQTSPKRVGAHHEEPDFMYELLLGGASERRVAQPACSWGAADWSTDAKDPAIAAHGKDEGHSKVWRRTRSE